MPFTFLVELIYKFKKELLIIAIVAAAIFGVWMWHINAVNQARETAITERDHYWTDLIANAPPKIKIDTITIWKSKKDTSGIGAAIAEEVDSVRQAYLAALKNKDSLLLALSAKQTFSHVMKDDSTYSMNYTGYWDPLMSNYSWKLTNIFIAQRQITIDKEKLIPLPFKRYAFTLSANMAGQTNLGLAYRLGSEMNPYDVWNNYMVGIDYQVIGPKYTMKSWQPIRLTVTGFFK